MFRELCGKAAYKNVVVLTTYWDQLSTHEEGVKREAQLKSKFFKTLVDGGAQFMRHDRTVESARAVLRHILPMPPTVTQIQKEIREEGKGLAETGAGSVHSKEVEDALAKYKKEISDLTADMATIQKSNTAARQELESELAELRNHWQGESGSSQS
jgi:septal ring factor EnvC (AmiA/AmiB activator)